LKATSTSSIVRNLQVQLEREREGNSSAREDFIKKAKAVSTIMAKRLKETQDSSEFYRDVSKRGGEEAEGCVSHRQDLIMDVDSDGDGTTPAYTSSAAIAGSTAPANNHSSNMIKPITVTASRRKGEWEREGEGSACPSASLPGPHCQL
jgi:hypothetical protein